MTDTTRCAHCANARRAGRGNSVNGSAEWHLFRRTDSRFGWPLIGDNGSDIVATDGNQGYSTAKEAENMMRKVRGGYTAAPMEPSAKK